MKDITPLVERQIRNYELTSRSKSYFRLRSANISKISKKLETHQHKHLLDLIQKRDRLNKKIYELLDTAGEETKPECITELSEADSYIKKYLLTQPEKLEKLNTLIKRHEKFHQETSAKKDALEKKVNTYCKKPTLELSKLANLQNREQSKHNNEAQRELGEFYLQVADQQRTLALASETLLKSLGVPFFSLKAELLDDTETESLSTSKARVLDLLKKRLNEEQL